jgi:hypothetical protein
MAEENSLIKHLTTQAIVMAPAFVSTAVLGPPGLLVAFPATVAMLALFKDDTSPPPSRDQKSE